MVRFVNVRKLAHSYVQAWLCLHPAPQLRPSTLAFLIGVLYRPKTRGTLRRGVVIKDR